MHSATLETADILIVTAAAHGHRITPVMLKKWRDAGLLARPRQRGLGRPGQQDEDIKRGSDALYPPGTSVQLLRLLAIRAEGRRFKPERALWRLWWEGFPIEDSRIRPLLDRDLQTLDAWWKTWQGLSPDDRIEQSMPLDRLPEPFRSIRERIGRPGMEWLTSVLTRIATGEFSSWEDAIERDAVLRGLGFDRAKQDRIGRAEPWLRGMLDEHLRKLAMIVRPDQLRDTLQRTSDDDLRHARDELQVFLGLLYTVQLTAESTLGRGAMGLGWLPHPNDLNHTVMPGVLLGWLAFRRDPTLYAGYQMLMHFAQSGAPLSFFSDLIRDAGTKDLPRQVVPSDNATI